MDLILKRQLRKIDRDKHSGANELALKAVKALQAWVPRNPSANEGDFLQVAGELLETQPDMAPFFRLANEVALAMDSGDPSAALLKSCQRIGAILSQGAVRIARQFRNAIARGPRKTILTYSYSSTVLRALVRSRSRIRQVYCSEASPEMEGKRLAAKLAKAGICVTLTTDLALPSFIHGADEGHPQPDAVVVGADQVLPRKFVNRYGTEILVEQSRRARVPFWVLADTSKFVRDIKRRVNTPRMEAPSRFWHGAPSGVTPWLALLGEAPIAPPVRILTEKGWMTPIQVRREISKIRMSPRLKALMETRN